MKISSALGVVANYLLTGRMVDIDTNELVKKIMSASPETQSKIERMIDILLEDQKIPSKA